MKTLLVAQRAHALRVALFLSLLVCTSLARPVSAQSLPPSAPPLPPPNGPVVSVSTTSQLQAAVATLTSGTTIVIAPGLYQLTQELRIRNGVTNVAVRGATNNRDDVVIVGSGMNVAGVNIALKAENAQDVLIANLSIGQTYYHPIQLQGEAGADRVHVYNVRLFDAGQQFLKSTVDPNNPNGVDDVVVEYSVIEYTNIGPDHGYTEGIDVHHGANWMIRYNLFRNIHVPATAPNRFRPAVLMWSGSRDTTVHSNVFIDCERGIIFGLGPQSGYAHSHSGGAIYNNFIYRTQPVNADAGISVWDSPGTRVLHNTVIQNGTYRSAIEYRFAGTTGVEIANNLTDGEIQQRDGAQGVVYANYTQANPTFFVDVDTANLHLTSAAWPAIDQGAAAVGVGVDIDGDSRPAGPAPDLGADERVVSVNQPPTAQVVASPTSGPAPLTVVFDGSGSSDPEAQPLSFAWSFGDGQNGSGSSISHAYNSAGSYAATLVVSDPQGASGSATVTISVQVAEQLAAPTNLRATVSGSDVSLTWIDNSTGEAGYVIERAPRKSTAFVEIARLPADSTSYLDSGLSRGTYRYRVRAVGSTAGQFSPYSNIAQAQVR